MYLEAMGLKWQLLNHYTGRVVVLVNLCNIVWPVCFQVLVSKLSLIEDYPQLCIFSIEFLGKGNIFKW